MRRATTWRLAPRMAAAVCAGALGVSALTGCESMPIKGNPLAMLPDSLGLGSSVKVGKLPPLPAPRQWPDAEQDVRAERARGYGLVHMPQMQAYLNGLLGNIKQAAGTPQWQGAVYITASSSLEAYCTGAGNIYVSLGWLDAAESEDEIVALLSHEFGHVYLNALQLEGTVAGTDEIAKWAAVGLSLAKKTGNATGWTPVDTLLLSYEAGKGTLAPAWSRNEEDSADKVGATLSLQLNYSFTRGFKTFLERQANWEAQNDKKREADKLQLVESLKQSTQNKVGKQNLGVQGPSQKALNDLQNALNGGVAEVSQGIGSALQDLVRNISQTHPDTEKRLTTLTEQVAPLLAGKPRPSATVQPWLDAQAHPVTAAVLQNYRTAFDAQTALQKQDHATARTLALAAASGPTADHALPTMLLSLTEGYAGAAEKRGRKPPVSKPIDPLDRNLQSERDRAWQIYTLRATRLLSGGQAVQAKAVIKDGLDYFGGTPSAWPDAIRFTAAADGWPAAKQVAQHCAKRFPTYQSICAQAAQSPQEVAASQALAEKKGNSLADRLLKK